MDLATYLPMFLAESREHLEQLNLAIVRVEDHPDDRETVDEIFRIAHSLKGMSATMGFGAMAALTHQMEDVLELLRQRGGGLDHSSIDVLLECLDTLEGAVDRIEANGAEELDAEELIGRLRTLVRKDDEERDAEEPAADVPAAALATPAGAVRAPVRLDAATQMPGVRALQVVQRLAPLGAIVRSAPSEAELDRFSGREVEIVLETTADRGAIEQAVQTVSDVERVTVETHEPAATADAGHHAKNGATVRVDAERLDMLMHLMGELVVQRTRVESLAAEAHVHGLTQAVSDLTRTSQALQAMVMQVRMIPVDAVFVRVPRLVRDLASKLGKKVELVLNGRETELDRTVVEALGDPIVHLVRNAVDHGIEAPADRAAAGKPETGTIEISARHAGGNVVISVRDDGHGIDAARIARKAVERGLIDADQEAYVDVAAAVELLFTPGFSTAETTSDVSGRGVGMDAVRTAVRGVGGEVVVNADPGGGTVAEIRLPLTLAIVAALLVDVGGDSFAIPLDRVERTLHLAGQALRSVAGRPMLVLRDEVLPLLDGGAAFHSPGVEPHDIVIVRAGDRRVALAVSHLIGQRELVTRPLPGELGDRGPVSGGAVLSNGDIALIVDCDALSRLALRPGAALASAA